MSQKDKINSRLLFRFGFWSKPAIQIRLKRLQNSSAGTHFQAPFIHFPLTHQQHLGMVVNIKLTRNQSSSLVEVNNLENSRDNFSVAAGGEHRGNLWIPYARSGLYVTVNIGGYIYRIYDQDYVVRASNPDGYVQDLLHVSGNTDVTMTITSRGVPQLTRQ
eukprot:Phypoly_transcript_24284.p1 GENE.Phypoly_transcript_24284~~Phypoly_transcript_24284.p1  ORF type:complete len:172 (+),score=13.26 Phypoly_transcript_24284:36-518(+)